MTPNETLKLRALAAIDYVTGKQMQVTKYLITFGVFRLRLKWPAPDMLRSNVGVAYQSLPLSWE